MSGLTKARAAEMCAVIVQQTEHLKRTRDWKKILACWACYNAAVDELVKTKPGAHAKLALALMDMRALATARGADIAAEMAGRGTWGVR